MPLFVGTRFALLNGSAGVSAATVYATLDGTATDVTLSNGNLTATHANTNSNSGARSTALKNSGKFYFEVTITDLEGTGDAIGILTAAGTLTNLVTNGTNCFAVYKSGNIYSNGAFSTKTLGAMGDGQVVQIAVDLDADLGWARRETIDWNGQSGDNPATGVGGISMSNFSGTTLAPAIGFGGTGTQTGDNMTCNFGATAFVHSVPAGFTAGWPV